MWKSTENKVTIIIIPCNKQPHFIACSRTVWHATEPCKVPPHLVTCGRILSSETSYLKKFRSWNCMQLCRNSGALFWTWRSSEKINTRWPRTMNAWVFKRGFFLTYFILFFLFMGICLVTRNKYNRRNVLNVKNFSSLILSTYSKVAF